MSILKKLHDSSSISSVLILSQLNLFSLYFNIKVILNTFDMITFKYIPNPNVILSILFLTRKFILTFLLLYLYHLSLLTDSFLTLWKSCYIKLISKYGVKLVLLILLSYISTFCIWINHF